MKSMQNNYKFYRNDIKFVTLLIKKKRKYHFYPEMVAGSQNR